MSRARFDESYGPNPAENYERFFVRWVGEPLARDLVDRANVRPGDRVLDVACGTGIVARLASERVEASVNLAGLDPNAAMLAVARAATPPRASIQWYEAPAEAMPLPDDSFDVVFCQMGLQFMADPSAAVGEMHRVLTPGGRLVLSLPGPIAGIFAALAPALARHLGPQAGAFVNQVFSLHDLEQVQHLLSGAGFLDVAVEATMHEFELPPPEEFLWQYIHSTPLAGVVSQTDADTKSAIEREVLAAWADFVEDGVLRHRLRLLVATGSKPQ